MKLFRPCIESLNKNKLKNKDKIEAWTRDQYHHLQIFIHWMILKWFGKNDIQYISSIPNCEPSIDNYNKNLFDKEEKGKFYKSNIIQFAMLFNKMGSEGGLFVL